MPQTREIPSEELRSALQHMLQSGHRRIVGLTRVRSAHAATSALEELDLVFSDGKRLRLMFKDLSHAMWPDGDIADPESDPAREIKMYEQVLGRADFGTPHFYGGIAGDERGRCWLFVEDVQGRRLDRVKDIGPWTAAARWLATMHCRLQALLPQMQKDVGLPVYDGAYFRRLVARALGHMQRVRGDNDDLVNLFATLAERCNGPFAELTRLARTLIHGDFHPRNIIIGADPGALRICVIDWEKAAEAPGLLDLATLVAKSRTREEGLVLALAYYEEMKSSAPLYLARPDFFRLLEICRLWVHLRRMTSHERWLTKESWLQESVGEIRQLCAQ
jgi:aminoglycoside phosphotransferase (APT) family kinase protein